MAIDVNWMTESPMARLFTADSAPDILEPESLGPVAGQALAAAHTYSLTTLCHDGRSHQLPVLAVWHEDALYFCANRASRKAHNLACTPACIVTADSRSLHLVVEGQARRVRDEATLDAVAAAYAAKYDWHLTGCKEGLDAHGAAMIAPVTYTVFRLTPTAVYGFRLGHAATFTCRPVQPV